MDYNYSIKDKDNDVNSNQMLKLTENASGRTSMKRRRTEAGQVVIRQNPQITTMKIGTWNVRTLLQAGKLENAKREMEMNNIDILGLSEIRWSDKGDINIEGFRMIYSGPEKKGKQGVGILLSKNHIYKVIQVSCVNERLMSIKLESTPVNTVLVQVYMPTSDSNEEEVDKIYELIEDFLENSKNDNVIVMGDFNAVIGEGEQTKYVGKYGLGIRNDRGDRLNEFATNNNNMFICNTWFTQPKRRRYTWKMPGDHGRYQLDYMLMRVRYRNCVKSCHSYPGADIGSDHNLVAMKIRSIRYKRVKGTKKKVRWNLQELENEDICKKYTNAVEEKLAESIKGDAEVRWQ